MKKDLSTRADLEQLLQQFYETLLQDAAMQHLFIVVAKVDLPAHLPSIVDFWEQALLQGNGYQRNVLQLHTDLHRRFPLTNAHFEYWLTVFEATVDASFEGAVAQKAKNRARSVAVVIQSKLARS
jgi:hemoglobin